MIYLCNSVFIKLRPYNLAHCWLVVPSLKNGAHFTHSHTIMVTFDPVTHSVHTCQFLISTLIIHISKFFFQKGQSNPLTSKIFHKILFTIKFHYLYRKTLFIFSQPKYIYFFIIMLHARAQHK